MKQVLLPDPAAAGAAGPGGRGKPQLCPGAGEFAPTLMLAGNIGPHPDPCAGDFCCRGCGDIAGRRVTGPGAAANACSLLLLEGLWPLTAAAGKAAGYIRNP